MKPTHAIACAGLAAAALAVAAPAAGQESIDVRELELVGASRAYEGSDTDFAVRPFDRPVRSDAEGYMPTVEAEAGGRLPTLWAQPVDITWDFGDGSPPVSSGERLAALHRYDEQGTYVVTATASIDGEPFASGSHEIEVRNREPRKVRITSVPDRAAPSTVELYASAIDTEEDSLLFHWDFGDGATEEGEDLWRVSHQYLAPGRYTVRLHVRDDDGGIAEEEEEVEVVDAADDATEVRELDEGDVTEVVRSRLHGSLEGAPSRALDAEVRSVYGIHLEAKRPGLCKLMLTAWDDANLGFFLIQFDLKGLSPEGSEYVFHRPNVVYSAESKAEHYLRQKQGTGMPGLGSPAQGLGMLQDMMRSLEDDSGESSQDDDAEPVDDVDDRPDTMPSVSPFGVKRSTGFGVEQGQATLTIIPGHSARGRLDVTLRSSDDDFPLTLDLDAELTLDLQRAARKGWIRYDDCYSGGLQIADVSPDDGAEHLRERRPWVRARFDKKVDPETLHDENIQVGYLDAGGTFQPAPGRILPDRYSVMFFPERDLRPGVRYTLRLRAGEEGVRGLDGSRLDDVEGDGWRRSSFWTHVDFTAHAGGNLSCHLFQTTRDAPLVPGKPVIARLYASWPKDDGVAASEQVKVFDGKVTLGGGDLKVTGTGYFVRPDLWEEYGIRTAHAEHTTQITGFVPPPDPTLRGPHVLIEKPGATGEGFRLSKDYRTICPARVWEHQPKLRVDVFALRVGPWEDDDIWTRELPVVQNVVRLAEEYAWQSFPVQEIRFSAVQPVDARRLFDQEFPGEEFPGSAEVDDWVQNLREQNWDRRASSADIVVLLGPHEVFGGGGRTERTLSQGHGFVGASVGPNPEYFSRYVFALVHELGHVLTLGHLPDVADSGMNQTRVGELKRSLMRRNATLWFQGIEGFRIEPGGSQGWNKSSVEGNAEADWLVPLMFPSTVATGRAFIADHHYRQIQQRLEDLGY